MVDILIVNFNSSKFIKLSLFALFKLTYHPFRVFIVDNGSELKDYKRLLKICSKYDNVEVERFETELRGSLAHGTALNYLVKKVKAPYFSILDADATWLQMHWDKILISRMNENVKVIGTQAPVVENSYKPLDFPLMFCILFKSDDFFKLDIDFRPADITTYQDTGWEIRDKYKKCGIGSEVLEMRNTRVFKDGPFKNCVCAEYYLDEYNHQPFCSHFGRGSSSRELTRYFNHLWYYNVPFLSKLTVKYNRNIEASKWIIICEKVIKRSIRFLQEYLVLWP